MIDRGRTTVYRHVILEMLMVAPGGTSCSVGGHFNMHAHLPRRAAGLGFAYSFCLFLSPLQLLVAPL